MRAFLAESAAPFLGVCSIIVGVTVTLFDVSEAPQIPRTVPPHIDSVTSAESAPPLQPPPPFAREQMNDVLARAMRQLDAARRTRPAVPSDPEGNAVAAIPPPTAASGAVDPGLLQAVGALGQAIKAVHDARTEEDIVRAEESMRGAREQMEANCKSGGGPLCEGAAQIRSLGY